MTWPVVEHRDNGEIDGYEKIVGQPHCHVVAANFAGPCAFDGFTKLPLYVLRPRPPIRIFEWLADHIFGFE